jgi:hypothetical protein
MKVLNLRSALCVVALAALAGPAAASAHPSLYLIQGKVARPLEKQTITMTATGGTWKPSAGAKTIPFDAPSWMVEDALGADAAIGRNATTGSNNVLVTGPVAGVYTLPFQGLATTNVPQVVPDTTGLTGGTATAATVQDGGGTTWTFANNSSGSNMTDTPQQAVIANDGNVTMWTESNGLTDHGWLNLKFLPSAFRAPMTGSQWLNWPAAQTGIQTHATCQNVPALNTEANVLAVQELFGANPVGDPFWNFVPFQKTSLAGGVGGDEDPAKWVAVVQTATGVNLNTLNTVAEFRASCEALNGGKGVYVPADTQGGSQASAQIASAVTAATDPLNAQIVDLQAAVAAAEAATQALLDRPLHLTLEGKQFARHVAVMVTGKAGDTIAVKLFVSKKAADRLGLSSRVIASANRKLGPAGATLVTLRPARAAAAALARRAGGTTVAVQAVDGTERVAASGLLTH